MKLTRLTDSTRPTRLTRLNSTRLDSTRLDSTRLDSTRLDSTRSLDSSREPRALIETKHVFGSPTLDSRLSTLPLPLSTSTFTSRIPTTLDSSRLATLSSWHSTLHSQLLRVDVRSSPPRPASTRIPSLFSLSSLSSLSETSRLVHLSPWRLTTNAGSRAVSRQGSTIHVFDIVAGIGRRSAVLRRRGPWPRRGDSRVRSPSRRSAPLASPSSRSRFYSISPPSDVPMRRQCARRQPPRPTIVGPSSFLGCLFLWASPSGALGSGAPLDRPVRGRFSRGHTGFRDVAGVTMPRW